MRIKTSQSKNQGSVLLVTLCTAWVIGIALVSYLTLVANQNRTTYHSQSWSGCIPVLEAGIEEALTQLNYNNGEGVTNAASHGWTLMTNGCYYKSQSVGPDTDGTYYEVTINPNSAGTPAWCAKATPRHICSFSMPISCRVGFSNSRGIMAMSRSPCS